MATLELSKQLFDEYIDLTRGRSVDVKAIEARLTSNKNKEFKIACMKLLIEGVNLTDNRKIGSNTIKRILDVNNVQTVGTKEAASDALTISRICRVLAPLLGKLPKPEEMFGDKPCPMSDISKSAPKYWLCISAMWCPAMWEDKEWCMAYLSTIAVIDFRTKGRSSGSGRSASLITRALRIVGKVITEPRSNDETEYVAAVMDQLDYDSFRPAVHLMGTETGAKKALSV